MPTATHASNPDRSIPDSADLLKNELRRALLALPYRAFLQVILHLLQTQGYSSVRPAGRSLWKGRNRAGGWDAEAEVSASPFGPLRCLVQAKQFDTLSIHQRSVDELRGSALRAGAQQALLITLSTFSPVAKQAAETKTALPVRLLSGEALLTLLLENHIGIVQNSQSRWHLNVFYFGLLQDRFRPPQAGDRQKQNKHEPSGKQTTSQPPRAQNAVQPATSPRSPLAASPRSRVFALRRQGRLTVTITVDAPENGEIAAFSSAP